MEKIKDVFSKQSKSWNSNIQSCNLQLGLWYPKRCSKPTYDRVNSPFGLRGPSSPAGGAENLRNIPFLSIFPSIFLVFSSKSGAPRGYINETAGAAPNKSRPRSRETINARCQLHYIPGFSLPFQRSKTIIGLEFQWFSMEMEHTGRRMRAARRGGELTK